MKRLFDVVFSLTMLIVLSPLLLAIACAVWLADRGPVVYRHQRVGRYGKPFYVYKFRSMRQNHPLKSELTFSKDPRITAVGSFLRASKLDELPQLVNVLKGEMSVVGPRPETPRYVAYYTDEEREALKLRPGLTGPASVLFRSQEQLLGGVDFEHYYITVLMPVKMQINLEYMRNQSFWLDLKIILHTIVVLIFPTSPPPLVSPDQAAQPRSSRLDTTSPLDALSRLDTPSRSENPARSTDPVAVVAYPPAKPADV